MTSIERTAYPRFARTPSVKELREMYTPNLGFVAFVATKARGPAQKFALMILLKVYQRLYYIPSQQTIPGAVISHIRAVMHVTERPRAGYFPLQPSIALETLLAEHCELPAFSTLDRMARPIRTLVNGGVYQSILAKLSDAEQQTLSDLLMSEEASAFTPFNRIKEAPKSATLTHLDEWLSRRWDAANSWGNAQSDLRTGWVGTQRLRRFPIQVSVTPPPNRTDEFPSIRLSSCSWEISQS